MVTRRGLACAVVLMCALLAGREGAAQDASATSAAFSLSSDRIFASRDQPAVTLNYLRVSHLDFRVYRVHDPLAFFAGLRDPHVLGSPEPLVPQERTWLERVAAWKADTREAIRRFVRRQFSSAYRVKRRETTEKQQVALRRTVRYQTFTQVPLLNPSQLVASWREMLPSFRDTESRRVPLDIREPGVYVVEGVNGHLKAYTVVVISDLGILTKSAPGQLLIWVAHRITGEPVAGCETRLLADQKLVASGTTANDGTYRVGLGQVSPDNLVAVARCGATVAVADPGAWYLQGKERDFVGYLYTDRPVYRPGHSVNIKGILRWRTPTGVLEPFDARQVEVSITDTNNKVLLRQSLPVDEFGSVRATFAVPKTASLGAYIIAVTAGDETAHGGFEVQEYRKPEFDVAVRAAERFVVQGGRAIFTIDARYYFGQPVSGGTVKAVVRRQPYYSPLRWDDDSEYSDDWYGGEQIGEYTRTLAANGTVTIAVPLPVNEEGHDYSLDLEARVTDASGREVSGHALTHSTHASFLVTLRPSQYVVQPGTRSPVDLRAMDYLGAPRAGERVSVWLEHLTYSSGYYGKPPIVEKVAESEVTTDAGGRASWEPDYPKRPGSYRVRAMARSADGRAVQASAHTWVPGSAERLDEDSYVELVPDKRSYQPGDTVRLLMRGADFKSPVLVTKEARGITFHRVVRYEPGQTIDVPVEKDDVGDTYVNVAFVKDDRFYRAEKRLSVEASSRQLRVVVTPAQPVSRPGEPGRVLVTVTDADGRPVRAQLSIGVVDEALYGVKADDTPDPVRFFYRQEYSRVGTEFSRSYSFVGYSGTRQLLLARRRRPTTLADFKAERPERPEVRKNFPDAIFWTANAVTDISGTTRVEFPYPDSLTTWRVTARAVTTDTMLGTAIARTVTTKDLITRIVAPRFLTEGDETEIPIVVHNFQASEKSIAIDTSVNGMSSVTPSAPAPERVTVAAGGEHRLTPRFKADAIGTVSIVARASTDGASDAMETSLPVLPYGLKRQVSASGSLVSAQEASATLTIPERSNEAARTIRVGLAPSMAGALLGALDFLTSYPYGCTEQTVSSFVPNLAVLRALEQLKLAPTARLASLDRQVAAGLERIYDYRHDDGGWGWWKTDETDPFMTAYALDGLIEARKTGYRVDGVVTAEGRQALQLLYAKYPRAVPDLKAYLAYVLGRAAQSDGARSETVAPSDRLQELWNARSRMSNYGRALLLLTLQAASDERRTTLEQELMSAVQTQGDLAWWPVDYDQLLGEPVDASVEATALAVRALVASRPKDALIERAVRWLLLNRNGGAYWSSTKQTSMVLSGLLEYMRARGEQAAPFHVDVFVNGVLAGSQEFTAADLTAPNPRVVSAPATAGVNRIRVVKRGSGTLYWSAEAEYYQRGGEIEATGSRKLAINRQYFSLTPVQQKGRTVYREVPFGGTAMPGDVLLVQLTIAGANDWRHLMLEDPLPAGAEPITQQSLYELEKRREWAPATREYRDNRVVFFQEDFERGRYQYVYLLKVVTPGTFRAMPAQIAPMYVPSVSASSDPQGVIFGSLPARGGF